MNILQTLLIREVLRMTACIDVIAMVMLAKRTLNLLAGRSYSSGVGSLDILCRRWTDAGGKCRRGLGL